MKRTIRSTDPRRGTYERAIELKPVTLACQACGEPFTVEHVPGTFLPRFCERVACQEQRHAAKRAATRARVQRLRARKATPQPGVTDLSITPGPAARERKRIPTGVEFGGGLRHWLGGGGRTLCGRLIPDTARRYTYDEQPNCRICRQHQITLQTDEE